jgi:hypothetical protein
MYITYIPPQAVSGTRGDGSVKLGGMPEYLQITS